MGSVRGQKHTKTRTYLTPEKKTALVARYREAVAAGVFLTQAQLAAEFDITQVACSKILRASGVKTRTREEAWPTAINPQEAARIYLENPRMTLEEIGELYDVGYAAVRDQLKKLGIPFRASKDYPKYTMCDRHFFAKPDPISAYFAGFIAADGFVTRSGLAVNFGIHPKDVEILNNLKKFATLDQPIIVKPNNSGKLYSWLSVCSSDWVKDLEHHYNIVTCKSLILKPPKLTDESLIWHYIRGYFDGDGHASMNGTTVNFISASPAFFSWLLPFCGPPGHVQTLRWLCESKNEYHTAQSAFFTGDVAATIARRMYKGSTPETRLERKRLRLARWLGIAAPARIEEDPNDALIDELLAKQGLTLPNKSVNV